jgi:peptidoglycan/xylan/chitin deacetylase (PgdA/CDA1 family)
MRKRNLVLVAASALAAVIWWQPRFLLRLAGQMSPRVLFFVQTEQPLVALSIDDSPHPTVTPRILDVLAEHEAHATFFIIGERIEGNKTILRRIVEEGHELGNHHMREAASIRLFPTAFEQQLLQTHALLTPFGPVKLFRPGSGWFNQRMLQQLERYGYTCVLGSGYAEDLLRSPWYLSRHILLNTRPGSIIILHDGRPERARTVTILQHVLPELQRRGYKVVTVSELVASKNDADTNTIGKFVGKQEAV